jgi:hypothetical protein
MAATAVVSENADGRSLEYGQWNMAKIVDSSSNKVWGWDQEAELEVGVRRMRCHLMTPHT